MIVLDKSIALTASDTMRHFPLRFSVGAQPSYMRIFFAYTPKVFQDREQSIALIRECYARYNVPCDNPQSELPLNNLITITLDSPKGRVGCAHRHANNAEYMISNSNSSCGFLRTPIFEGEWEIIVSTHCILSKEVNVAIRVEVGE
ncbi:MAG: hypothetical protein WC292_04445 [Clostridia bacterium]